MKAIVHKFDTFEYFLTSPRVEYDTVKAYHHEQDMSRNVWVNLAGMLLFLVSAISGAALLWVGRKNARGGVRQSAV